MTVIIAHRGSAGTHPENTLPAFMEAVLIRCGWDRAGCASNGRPAISSYP